MYFSPSSASGLKGDRGFSLHLSPAAAPKCPIEPGALANVDTSGDDIRMLDRTDDFEMHAENAAWGRDNEVVWQVRGAELRKS